MRLLVTLWLRLESGVVGFLSERSFFLGSYFVSNYSLVQCACLTSRLYLLNPK